MTTTTAPSPAAPLFGSVSRGVEAIAGVFDIYSRAAVRIAQVIVVISTSALILALAANVFTRNALGFSLFGAEEFARFAFLWMIWMGVSLAVRRGAVTVIGFVANAGSPLWQRSVKAFSGLSLGVLLIYACWKSTQYATGVGTSPALEGVSPALNIPFFYPIASMTLGYYLITLHYSTGMLKGAAKLIGEGPVSIWKAGSGFVGGVLIAAVVLGTSALLLEGGASPLLALAVIFVALTLAGTPIVFMLSIVGIIAMTPDFLGLDFYPNPDSLTPFRTTQTAMGLSGSTELLVIASFLVVAEVLNRSGMTAILIQAVATLVGHLRGGLAYVAQLTSVLVSGISGSAQADAAIMTPLLVPEMEKQGYRRDVAAAVIAGASIKGPIGPISIMFIVYGFVVGGSDGRASLGELLLSGIVAIFLLFVLQAATIYFVVRRMKLLEGRAFVGWPTVGRSLAKATPILLIPLVIIGGILSGIFTPAESAAVGAVITVTMALFLYSSLSIWDLPSAIILAGIETGIVLLLLGDSAILARALETALFGQDVESFLTGITDNKYLFLLIVNVLLLAIGIFLEPLPAVYILAPVLAPIAVVEYGVDPVHFGLIMVFNLVLALIHPPIGLVIFLVSSIARVSIERLSIMILPWLGVSLLVLALITYMPTEITLFFSNTFG